MLQRVAAVPGIESRDLSTVEWILQGAAMMPPALLRTWFDLLAPEKVIMAYGMTEQLGPDRPDAASEWLTHEGSVGRGFRDTEIRILDEAQNPVPIGDFGDVYMRSPATGAYDYLGGAPLLPTTADGFGTAGDMGRLDEEGYLYLADRRVDMIITGGANVFPAEVESALVRASRHRRCRRHRARRSGLGPAGARDRRARCRARPRCPKPTSSPSSRSGSRRTRRRRRWSSSRSFRAGRHQDQPVGPRARSAAADGRR